jgi:hypothetical protein
VKPGDVLPVMSDCPSTHEFGNAAELGPLHEPPEEAILLVVSMSWSMDKRTSFTPTRNSTQPAFTSARVTYINEQEHARLDIIKTLTVIMVMIN